jgi:hypothetical protein
MVFFALTRSGYQELVSILGRTPSPIWVSEGVLTDAEIAKLHSADIDVSNFTSVIDGNSVEEVEEAIETIKLHHPGQSVWVEHGAEKNEL